MITAVALTLLSASTLDVRIAQRDGDAICSVEARSVRVLDVAAQIAALTGRTVVGLSDEAGRITVDLELQERSLESTLSALAGAAGLVVSIDAKQIVFTPDVGAHSTQAELDEAAELAWLRTARTYADHPRAADAHWNLGLAEERRGNVTAAAVHFETVAQRFPASDLTPQALLHQAQALEASAEWSDAATVWSQLANHGSRHPFQTQARLGLARAWAKKGDGRLALSLLESLDQLYPVTVGSEHIERLCVRARALQAAGRANEALDVLDEAARLEPTLSETLDTLQLRAEIASAMGELDEASRLWFAASRRAQPADAARLLTLAADAAREAGDLVGLLFLERVAKGTAASAAIELMATEARSTLGLDPTLAQLAAPARVTRARELRAAGECGRAYIVLEPLLVDRTGLDEAQWLEAVELAARCADQEHGVERAAQILRAAASQAQPDALRRLCLLAGELYESRELWDLAADAFGGRL